MYKLIVKVANVEGSCGVHKTGDYFEIRDDALYIPEGKRVCTWSLSTLLPFLSACQRQITDKKDWLPNVGEIHCPDPEGKVYWQIEKLPL
ncbi:MAG: TIGR04076 family protein [Candidatus Odinarchaeota archaeon]